jgi:hypothetical protein
MTKPSIPLFDRNRDHPSVPTWRLPERCAHARSRMPLAAPPKAARSVLDGAEHSATLISQGRHHRRRPARLPPRQNCLMIGGESPPVGG